MALSTKIFDSLFTALLFTDSDKLHFWSDEATSCIFQLRYRDIVTHAVAVAV